MKTESSDIEIVTREPRRESRVAKWVFNIYEMSVE
jgi:hypothetical protein